MSPVSYAKEATKNRRLHLKNMHTEEEEKLVYWKNGKYISSSMEKIDHLLRDHRYDLSVPIDKNLIDSIYRIHSTIEAPYGIEIYSGFRSPETNSALRKKNKGVASKSYHMYGRAVDLRMPGVKLSTVNKAAKSLKLGGVGYYSRSGFVHIDTGRIRHWGS